MIKKTKIIATLGPSTDHPHMISRLIKKGVDVIRLNMSHLYNRKRVIELVDIIRQESRKNERHIGILMDIAGPKIRVDLSNIGNEELDIKKNHVYNLGFSKMNDIPINMDIKFNNSVDLNAFVKIDDGNVSFKVLGIRNNVIKLKSMQSAIVKSNKGINFPGVILKVPSITPKDQENIKLGIKLDIDWFALSFVRSSNDIKLFKEILVGKKKNIPIIAKIFGT